MSLPTASHQDVTNDHQKRLSLCEVLIVEAIDLDVWIFMPTPRWVSTIMVYDNEFIWGDHEIERTMVTQEMQGFLDRFRPLGG
jgi:hypothetical protein